VNRIGRRVDVTGENPLVAANALLLGRRRRHPRTLVTAVALVLEE
jgi:hypothetical protein